MGTAEKFKDYASECVRKAGEAPTPEDKTLMLNMGLAWLRLAQQVEEIRGVHAELPAEAAVAG